MSKFLSSASNSGHHGGKKGGVWLFWLSREAVQGKGMTYIQASNSFPAACLSEYHDVGYILRSSLDLAAEKRRSVGISGEIE